MKKILLIMTVSCFIATVSYGQTSNWLWAKTAGGNFEDVGNSISSDSKGNIFVTGYFNSSHLTFGSTILDNYGSNGGNLHKDMFLAKYDSLGNLLWAKSAGGNSEDYAYSLCTDSSGNILVTGTFSSQSIIFGYDTLINNSMGYGYIFLVKYDGSGNTLWAKSIIGNCSNNRTSVHTDSRGNTFITGSYTSPSITFDSITLNNNASSGYSNIFLAKYDTSGNVLWAKSFGGIGGTYGGDNAKSICTDGNGNAYITGGFYSHIIVFDSDTLTNVDTVFSNADIYIAKFDSLGNVLWAKREGGTDVDEGNSITIDANGNMYVTGYFESYTFTLGAFTFTNSSISGFSTFLVKYNSLGNVLWAKSSNGNFKSTSIDKNGNLFAIGSFYSSIIFDTDTLNNTGFSDLFLTKYDSSGKVYWARTAAQYGSGYNSANFVSTDKNGNAYITGSFSSHNITFDSTFNNYGGGPCPGGCSDVFIAKFCKSNAFITGNATLCNGQSTLLTVNTSGTNYLWSTGDTTASIVVSPASTTTYSVTASLGTFIATATTTVVVNQNPPPIAGMYYIVNGIAVDFHDSSTAWMGDSIVGWNWLFPGGYPSGSTFENPGIVYYSAGTFDACLTVISSNGCTNTTCDTILILSINELKNSSAKTVFPNPTTDHLTFEGLNNRTIAQVYDISGKLLLSKQLNENQIDISSLAKGLYFIKLSTGEGSVVRKFVKE